ncbi:MAG: DUF6263 family protein [Pirellulaceae bacterium]|nr:DUF6263 family protein [Pirellulaceae bacterium]
MMRSLLSHVRFVLATCFILCGATLLPASALSAALPQAVGHAIDEKVQEKAANQPQVLLVDAGQAPHRTLRLSPSVGSKQRHELTMAMTMGSEANGQKSPSMKIPTVKYTMDSTISDVSATGDVAFTVEYTDATIVKDDQAPLDMIESMEGVMTSLIGLQFKSTVDHRGFAKGVTLELPEGIDPVVAGQIEQLSNSVEQLTSPFPAEAVGVGGKWKLTTPMNSSGMKFVQTVQYTVVEMTESTVTVTVEISQAAEEQEMDLQDAGVEARLLSLDCRGQGRMKLNLAAIFSDEASVKADVKVEMIVKAGQDIELTQEVSTHVQLKALPLPESKEGSAP